MRRIAKCAFCGAQRDLPDGSNNPSAAQPFEEFGVAPAGYPRRRWLCASCAALVRSQPVPGKSKPAPSPTWDDLIAGL